MKIVIVGGYGAFGRRLVTRLCENAALELIIAGRRLSKAQAFVNELGATLHPPAKLRAAAIDATHCTPETFKKLKADVVVNASGPFQDQDYTLAQCAIASGCHAIDLADARAFVTGITTLDNDARKAGVVVISGASTVPGLSSAVVQHYRPQFARLRTIAIAISPGNHFNPGIATTASVLGYVGHPLKVRRHGETTVVYGWQGLSRSNIPGVGKRWMGYVDVPDLDLFPKTDPDLETVEMKAGLEVSFFHVGLWSVSWLVRSGLVKSLAGLAAPLIKVKGALSWLGSDIGGMSITLTGDGQDGAPLTVDWSLAAYNGHGPYIPTLAAQILVEQLAAGRTFEPGARACFEMISLVDFEESVRGIDIEFSTTEN